MADDTLKTIHKRMPLMMEESEYIVGLIDRPKNGATDWPLIINLLRLLADKIEECRMSSQTPLCRICRRALHLVNEFRDTGMCPECADDIDFDVGPRTADQTRAALRTAKRRS